MGSEESKTWVFENVLFLDPNMPPFVSEEEYRKRKRAEALAAKQAADPYGQVDPGGTKEPRRTAKVQNPSHARVRNRVFRVWVEMSGKFSEFQLKCSTDPLALILCDRRGSELRSIPSSGIKYMQRKGLQVDAQFQGEGGAVASMAFKFADHHEASAFVDAVKVVFGKYVHEFGLRKHDFRGNASGNSSENASDSPDQSTKKRATRKTRMKAGCPVHGDEPCNCDVERPVLAKAEELSGEDEDPDNPFPVAIQGSVETHTALRHKELTPHGRRVPPKAVEWFVSRRPGRDPIFPTTPTASTEMFIPTDLMVGHFIRLRVVRRRRELTSEKAVVYSVAMKGPVTVDDDMARTILHWLVSPEFSLEVQLTINQVELLYGVDRRTFPGDLSLQPLFYGSLIIKRRGVTVTVRTTKKQSKKEPELAISFLWSEICPGRASVEEAEASPEEDLTLLVHTKDINDNRLTHRLNLPTENDRNAVFHVMCFYKLSPDYQGFDRWVNDLKSGNFTIFKQRYAKLWASISWQDLVKGLHSSSARRDSAISIPQSFGSIVSSSSADSGGYYAADGTYYNSTEAYNQGWYGDDGNWYTPDGLVYGADGTLIGTFDTGKSRQAPPSSMPSSKPAAQEDSAYYEQGEIEEEAGMEEYEEDVGSQEVEEETEYHGFRRHRRK